MTLAAWTIRRVVYPAWVRKNASSRLRYLSELEESQFLSADEHRERQFAGLRAVLAFAYKNCPYYQEKYRKAGLKPEDIRCPGDLNAIPTLSKQEIQENRDGMLSTGVTQDALIEDMTGGSTGAPLRFCYTKDRHDWREASSLRHDKWTGWSIGDRRAVLWGAPQDVRYPTGWKSRAREQLIERRIFLDASSLTEAAMREFVSQIQRHRPVLLQAYANSLGYFARYVRENVRMRLGIKAVVTSAEVLTPENRALIESAFDCPVFDRYGSREFSVIASECASHRGMHVNAESLLVEAISDGKARSDQDGELVVSDLRNLAMPMIRYQIGDVGQVLASSCKCGRGLPLMKLSGGRVTDFLVSADGARVSGVVVATYVITRLPGIRQVQFGQSSRDVVDVRVVRGQGWTEDSERELISRLRHYLGQAMGVRVQYVSEIPPSASGKHRFTISSIGG